VAGVAGGIGERFDIDANVVRVVFIVLTLAAGLGAAIYLAMWACVPQSGAQEGDEVANTRMADTHWRFRSLVLLAGALCLGLIFLTVALNGHNIGRGIGLFWLVFLVVLAVGSFAPPWAVSLVRFFLGLLIAVVSLAILASGGVLAYVAATGVPMTVALVRGFTSRTRWRRSSVSNRLAIGSMTIDLRGVGFRDESMAIVATVAVGQLTSRYHLAYRSISMPRAEQARLFIPTAPVVLSVGTSKAARHI